LASGTVRNSEAQQASEMSNPWEPRDVHADLMQRHIPMMDFSPALSPLTAPLKPLPKSMSRTERARARFACPGNAVITGGAGTLALATARALIEHDTTQITLLDLPATLKVSETSIAALSADFPDAKIHQFPVDVTSEEAITSAFASAHAAMGSIDMLLCFAGIVGCVHSMDVTGTAFKKVIDVNLSGSFLCAQAAGRFMMHNGGGSILFTASISAHTTNYPQPQSAYNISKAGVVHMTRNLAGEWAVYGIRVNCISPGYMDTILNAGDNLAPIRKVWASRNPMGRMGDVDEITGPVISLMAARAGRYTTGSNLTVDGGALCF
jgi:sorbose reductase